MVATVCAFLDDVLVDSTELLAVIDWCLATTVEAEASASGPKRRTPAGVR